MFFGRTYAENIAIFQELVQFRNLLLFILTSREFVREAMLRKNESWEGIASLLFCGKMLCCSDEGHEVYSPYPLIPLDFPLFVPINAKIKSRQNQRQ